MPVKSNGDMSETFSTAKKDTDKMLSTWKNQKPNTELMLSSCYSRKDFGFQKRNVA